jgi:hypothetical protein
MTNVFFGELLIFDGILICDLFVSVFDVAVSIIVGY